MPERRYRSDWFSKLIPCWSCHSRLAWDCCTNSTRMWMVCIGCGRNWLVTIEPNAKWLVLRFSIPKLPRARKWDWFMEMDTRDVAWEAYVNQMLRLGEEPAPRKKWDLRRIAHVS